MWTFSIPKQRDLFIEEDHTRHILKRIYYMHFSSCDVQLNVSSKSSSWYSESGSTRSKHRDQMSMCLTVAFKVLIKKKWRIIKLSCKTWSRLPTRVFFSIGLWKNFVVLNGWLLMAGGSTWKWDCTIYGYNMEQIMLLQNSTGAFSGTFIRLQTFL